MWSSINFSSKLTTFGRVKLRVFHLLPTFLFGSVSLLFLLLLILPKFLSLLALTHGLSLHCSVFKIGLEHGPVPNDLDESILFNRDCPLHTFAEIFPLGPLSCHFLEIHLLRSLCSLFAPEINTLLIGFGLGRLFFLGIFLCFLPWCVFFLRCHQVIVALCPPCDHVLNFFQSIKTNFSHTLNQHIFQTIRLLRRIGDDTFSCCLVNGQTLGNETQTLFSRKGLTVSKRCISHIRNIDNAEGTDGLWIIVPLWYHQQSVCKVSGLIFQHFLCFLHATTFDVLCPTD